MSTRSAVIIPQPYADTELHLYRHCDGYPAIAGAAILAALAESSTEERLASALLVMEYENKPLGDWLRPVYHVIDRNEHRDTDWEHVYRVRRVADGSWVIDHAARGRLTGDVRTWPKTTYTVPQFVTFVNAERWGMKWPPIDEYGLEVATDEPMERTGPQDDWAAATDDGSPLRGAGSHRRRVQSPAPRKGTTPSDQDTNSMKIAAKFNSTCPACSGRIRKGDPIEYTRGTPAVHVACAKEATRGPDITDILYEDACARACGL